MADTTTTDRDKDKKKKSQSPQILGNRVHKVMRVFMSVIEIF